MKTKQIKKLNEDIIQKTHDVIVSAREFSKYGGFDGYKEIYTMDIAKHLYDKGYRKQEWFSVRDALPEKAGEYLTYHGGFYMLLNYSPRYKVFNVTDKPETAITSVTHWMPLPEAPKGE